MDVVLQNTSWWKIPVKKSSGVFSGYLLFYWYETVDGRIVYDDIDDYSDSFCNNQYAGSWRSNSTRKAKPCAWGQYRVPICGDLDIGLGSSLSIPSMLNTVGKNSIGHGPISVLAL